MDYYGDFPAPPETEIIKDITSKLSTLDKYKEKNIFTIKKCVKKSLEDMGGHKSLGSFSGYLVFSKKELMQRTEQLLDNSKIVKFRTIVKIVMALNNTYNIILHNRYKPNMDKTYPRPTSSNLIQSKGMRPTTPQNNSVKTPVESLKAPALKQARASYRSGSKRFQAKLSRIPFNHLLTQSHHMHLIRTIGLTTPASVIKGFGHRIIGR